MTAPPAAAAVRETWDVLVIGTGVGGATLGYALARQGKRVLFCEHGRSTVGAGEALRGDYAEMFFPQIAAPQERHRAVLERCGRWADALEDQSALRPRHHIPFLGAGTGGSSALYGGAMERFFPEDFTPGACFPHEDAVDLPDTWPIQYQDLAAYYRQAEQLYRVKGGADPLRADAQDSGIQETCSFGPANQALAARLRQQGLHPYRLPLACELLPGCQTCQGFLCSRECKNDSARICLEPALRDHQAQLLDQCTVLRLVANKHRVTSVVCKHHGEKIELTGKLIILAAGALASPALLLRSCSDAWPQGLANDSGAVGHYLMRHNIDLYAVTASVRPTPVENVKELAFNDFYYRDGEKLGSVQSFGRLPPAPMLAEALQQDVREASGAVVGGLLGLAKPILARAMRAMLESTVVLAATLEDLPYRENRVMPLGSNGIALNYRLTANAKRRIERFRHLMRETLKDGRFRLIKQAENNDRIAHACGTCRMGADARTSVVDAQNRAHGLENLYIVDSSFFPSSAGTNPSLTLAANALRVADVLAESG